MQIKDIKPKWPKYMRSIELLLFGLSHLDSYISKGTYPSHSQLKEISDEY